MATMTVKTRTLSPYPISLILLIVMAVLSYYTLPRLMLMAVSQHALEKHGEKAIIASQCADKPELRMFNEETGRIAHICRTEAGWGIAITESDGSPVTSFIKDKAHRLNQVVQYLINAGYALVP